MKNDKLKPQSSDRVSEEQERKNQGPLSEQQHLSLASNSNAINKDKPPGPLFNAEVARSPFSKYGFSGLTIYNANRHETTTNLYCYQLSFKGIAKNSTLRQKFQIICGSIWTKASKDDPRIAIHPLFKYLIQKTMTYDYLFNVKETEYINRIADEFKDNEDGAERKELLADFANWLKDHFHQKTQQKNKYESQKKDKIKRIQKLKAFDKNMTLLRTKYEKCFISILKSRFQSGNFSFYSHTTDQMNAFEWPDIVHIAKKLTTYVDAIEPLKIYQQQKRLRLFQKQHKTYYKTNFVLPKLPYDPLDINISKYSQEPEAILHTIVDHVFLRKKNQKENLGVSVQMIKDICVALKVYEKTVTKELQNKKYYDFVSPQHIIFDQFSLHPKLKYEPILQQALGLRNKPLSIENLITFFPTPENFNYFRSLQEFDEETKLILNDPFFGNLQLHGDDKQKRLKEEQEDIEAERVYLLKIKENMLVWKFLLTSYYMINGCEFGKDNHLVKEVDISAHFNKELTRAMHGLSKRQSNLQQFLGVVRQQSKEFNFTLEELMGYLRLDLKDDVFQNFRYARLKIYHNLRNILLKEIIKIFICDTILVKMYNVKKYMCIFSILVNQLLEEAETLQACESAKSGERSNVRLTLDRDMKLKNGKTYYEYLCTTYEKIIQYQKRDKGRDLQARYLTFDTEGVKHYEQIKYMKKYIDKLVDLTNQLKKHEDKSKSKDEQPLLKMQNQFDKQDDTIYFRTLSELKQSLQLQTPKIRLSLCNLMLKQLNVSQPSDLKYHKISNHTPLVEQSLIFFNEKLITLVSSLLLFDKNQLCNFESLVIPMLRVDDSQKRYEIRIFGNKRQIKDENENVMFIRELLLVQEGGERRTITEMKQVVRDLLCKKNVMVNQSISHETDFCRPKSQTGSILRDRSERQDQINYSSHQLKRTSLPSPLSDQRNRNREK